MTATTYRYVSLMRASRDNPPWEDSAGDERLFAGKHPDVWLPKVYDEERDQVGAARYERLALAKLPKRMQADEAFAWVYDHVPGGFEEHCSEGAISS